MSQFEAHSIALPVVVRDGLIGVAGLRRMTSQSASFPTIQDVPDCGIAFRAELLVMGAIGFANQHVLIRGQSSHWNPPYGANHSGTKTKRTNRFNANKGPGGEEGSPPGPGRGDVLRYADRGRSNIAVFRQQASENSAHSN